MKKLKTINPKQNLLHLALAALLLAAIAVPVIATLQPEPTRAMTGSGTAGDPYMIYDIDDLQAMRYMDLSKHYKLANDIDATATVSWNGGYGFLPIGEPHVSEFWYAGPGSDNTSSGSWVLTPSDGTFYDKVDVYLYPDTTTNIKATAHNDTIMFNLSNTPAIPAGSPIQNIIVTLLCKEATSGTTGIAGRIRVGGNNYAALAQDAGSNVWLTRTFAWATNPKTSANWTVDDVNGVGDNALETFGCIVTDASPNVLIAGAVLEIQYEPLVTPTGPFTGTFDGNSKTISDLYIWSSDVGSIISEMGLFSTIGSNAVIKDVTLSNMVFGAHPTSFAGALVGYMEYFSENVTISNCHMSGTAIIGDDSGSLIGFLPGQATVTNCSSSATIINQGIGLTANYGAEIGGLIGYAGWADNGQKCTISGCSFTGSFTSDGPADEVGGLIGYADYVEITSSYSTGSITIERSSGLIGGLIGYLHKGHISNCYSTGSVTALGNSSSQVGGFIGYVNGADYSSQTSITDCYSTGTVTARRYAGGFIGYLGSAAVDDLIAISRCYSTGDVIAIEDSYYYGGFAGGNNGLIDQCWASGDIYIDDTQAGYYYAGFVGQNAGHITNCYSRGNVGVYSDTGWAEGLAGFVGVTHMVAIGIENCYSTAILTPVYMLGAQPGGFCSEDDYDSITDCFYNSDLCSWTGDGGTGATTDDMTYAYGDTSIFTTAGWDFDSIWCVPTGTTNDGYPILQNNLPPGGACGCLLPPENLIATPVSSTRIDLSWYNPNSDDDWPDLIVLIRCRTATYPADPPSGSDSKLALYRSAGDTGNDSTSHVDLEPGTTYFYRVWFYEPNLEVYTTYSEDFATTFAGIAPAGIEEPPEWFQEPSCLSYYETPLWPAMNYALTTYEWPEGYFCMAVSLLLISIVCLLSYGIAAIGTQGSVKSIAVPFILGAGLIGYGGVYMSLFPFGLTIVAFIILGGVGVFVWTKA